VIRERIKRALRLLALVGAAAYGTGLILHVVSYPREGVPAEILNAIIFLCFVGLYIYLVRSLRPS
jgi:hypothetical protein